MSIDDNAEKQAAGTFLGVDVPEWDRDRQEMCAREALEILQRAKLIRADERLMTMVRAYVRLERDRLGVLMDEL
jgi:hypothetical protein